MRTNPRMKPFALHLSGLAITVISGACASDGKDMGEPLVTLFGQVESRMAAPVDSIQITLGFLDARDRPVAFQAVEVTGSFPAQFQLEVFGAPPPGVPAITEGVLDDTIDHQSYPYKITIARIFALSADSNLDDPANVRILGWDPSHLVFHTATPAEDLRLAFGGDFVFGKFAVGYDLAEGNARPPAQYAADAECQGAEEIRYFYVEPKDAATEAEHQRIIAEDCHGGRSDNITPAAGGLATQLNVPIVDDPDTLGVLHPRGVIF